MAMRAVRRQEVIRRNEPAIVRIYRDWDDALARGDAEALLALYAPDAVIESPLIPHVLGVEHGIVRGREKIRSLFQAVADRKLPVRRRHRGKNFTDGETIFWEYPRQTPDGEQTDFVEVMEIENGLIQRHRVYWGWYGIQALQDDEVSQAGGASPSVVEDHPGGVALARSNAANPVA
jgi:ketosteroid isomerase-like protein